MRVSVLGRRLSMMLLTSVCLVLSSFGPAVAADPVGPRATVKGNVAGSVRVSVRLLDNDSFRLCLKGSGVADGVALWKTDGAAEKHRRSAYSGSGCSRFHHAFGPGTAVHYRACFADPRRPRKLYCGEWRRTSAT